MRIAAIVFFVYICLVLFFFSTIGGPFDNLVGVDTNEIMQDWMERNLGLKNILNGHLKKDFKVKTLYKDGVFISILNKDQLIFDKARGYSGYVHNNHFWNEAKGNKYELFQFQWNHNFLGKVASVKFKIGEWKFYIYFAIILPTFIFFIFYFCMRYHLLKNEKTNWRTLYTELNIWAVLFSVIWFSHLMLFTPHWRNYTDSYKETYKVILQNIDKLKPILNNAADIGIYPVAFLAGFEKQPQANCNIERKPYFPITSQERNIHGGKVFISKTPIFPYEYIRINIDLFNYLFYAPDLKQDDLKKINAAMTYVHLKDDIWLGQYQLFIGNIHRIVYIYILACLMWLVVLSYSIHALLKKY